MTDTPPFRRGQVVETNWLALRRYERCVVERCERAKIHTQTGWMVWVEGGLPESWGNQKRRVNGLDSGWFRPVEVPA